MLSLTPHVKRNAQGLSRNMEILSTRFENFGVLKINIRNQYDTFRT